MFQDFGRDGQSGDAWRTGVRKRELFRQGYLAGSELCSARVRVAGDLEAATAALQRIADQFPTSALAEQARERLHAGGR